MSCIFINKVGVFELNEIIKFHFCSFLAFKTFHKLLQLWKSSRKSPITLRLHSPKACFCSLLRSCFIQHITWEPCRDKNYGVRVVRNFHSRACCEHYICQLSWDWMTNEASIIKVQSGNRNVLLFPWFWYWLIATLNLCAGKKKKKFVFHLKCIRVKKFNFHNVTIVDPFTFSHFK